jgi:hypothetical protein
MTFSRPMVWKSKITYQAVYVLFHDQWSGKIRWLFHDQWSGKNEMTFSRPVVSKNEMAFFTTTSQEKRDTFGEHPLDLLTIKSEWPYYNQHLLPIKFEWPH